mgnify:CR=1 FL=1
MANMQSMRELPHLFSLSKSTVHSTVLGMIDAGMQEIVLVEFIKMMIVCTYLKLKTLLLMNVTKVFLYMYTINFSLF